MSWNTLLENMSQEINRKQTVYKKKEPELRLFEQIALEVTKDDDMDEAVGDTLKKAGQAVKRGWMKLKGKIKEVARWGFRLGVAVGKTLSGKFVLFNTSGNVLVPEAESIGYKKMKGSNKSALTLEYNVVPLKGKNMEIHMDDKLSFGFGTGFGPQGQGIMYVVEPKNPGLREGIDYKLSQLTEATDREKAAQAALMSAEASVFDSFLEAGADILTKTEDEMPEVAPVDVNYDDFKKELKSLMRMVKEDEVLTDSKIKNLAIYAPTGWGKSQIIESIAEEEDYFYFPLELQKVDINVVAGFPYLSDVKDIEGSPDEVKGERLETARKIVKVAGSQYLPPSKAPGAWLLFFDEFNRADTEKMAAVMNLLLTGELGGAAELIRAGDDDKGELDRYRLPDKVVVVLAMNTQTQSGVTGAINAVQDLDIATLERVHRVLHGRYHATSWFTNYAHKPYMARLKNGREFPMISKIPPIITNYIIQTMKETGGGKITPEAEEAPFLLPVKVAQKETGAGGGGERTTSPRSWTVVAQRMLEDGYQLFKLLDIEDLRERYGKRAKQIMKKMIETSKSLQVTQIEKNKDGITTTAKKGNVDTPDNPDEYLFAAWLQDANNQEKLLANQSAEFGDEGKEYITRMIVSYRKKAKEGISIEEILLNYGKVRALFTKSFKNLGFGGHAQFLKNVVHTLNGFKSEQDLINTMEERGIPIVSTKGPAEQIYLTLKTIQQDLDMNADDFVSFAHLIDAASSENELIAKIARRMAGKWETYRQALEMKYKTKSQIQKELESGGKLGTPEKPEPADAEANEELEQLFGRLIGRL